MLAYASLYSITLSIVSTVREVKGERGKRKKNFTNKGGKNGSILFFFNLPMSLRKRKVITTSYLSNIFTSERRKSTYNLML